MSQEYTIKAVSEHTRTYDTKFGQMISYKLKLDGVDAPVELGQKTTTPAPQAGQTLYGHIEETTFGPKFKKEQPQDFGQARTSSGSTPTSTSKGKFDNDPFTMYLSYAKDIAVTLIEAGVQKEEFEEVYGFYLENAVLGGKTLYEGRPGAAPKEEAVSADTPVAEMKKEVDDFFSDGTAIVDKETLDSIPF